MEIKVYNMQGKEVEVLSLDGDIFEGEYWSSDLREAVLGYRASH